MDTSFFIFGFDMLQQLLFLAFVATVSIAATSDDGSHWTDVFFHTPPHAPVHTLFRKSLFDTVSVGSSVTLNNNVKYILINELKTARGFEKVFKAIEKGRNVRIKFLKDTYLTQHDITNEIEITKRMSEHPNSVDMYYSQQDKGTAVVVTEFLREAAWKSKTKSLDILNAVKTMQSYNLLHRDLSSETVRFGDDKVLKIADYSWAVYTKVSLTKRVGSNSMDYWAPERLQYATYGPASDIWSIGVILSQIHANGRHPYSGTLSSTESPAVLLEKIVKMDTKNDPMLEFMPNKRHFPNEAVQSPVKQSIWESLITVHDEMPIKKWLRKISPSIITAKIGDVVRVCNEEYILIQILGRGSFGRVFKAKNTKTNELVAMKIASSKLNDRTMINTEMKALEIMSSHPNSITFICAENNFTTAYIVMELADGSDLSSYQRLSKSQVKKITMDMQSVLREMRQHDIIHRDIKPLNMMFSKKENKMTLIDYGISIQTKEKMRMLTGTPGFIAPEVFRGLSDRNVDIWAAGVSIYFLVTRDLPFGFTTSQFDTEAAMKKLRAANPDKHVQDFVEQALQIDPKSREAALTLADNKKFRSFF